MEDFYAFKVKEVANAETGDQIDFQAVKLDNNLNINPEDQKEKKNNKSNEYGI